MTHHRQRRSVWTSVLAIIGLTLGGSLVATSAAADDPVVIYDLDFDTTGLEGWTANGDASVGIVADSADLNNQVVAVTNRAQNHDALRSPSGMIESGVEYTITAQVRHATGSEAHWMAHEPGESNDYPWMQGGPVALPAGEWTEVSATRTWQTATPGSAFAYLEVPGGDGDYEVDNLVVTAVGSPSGEPGACEPIYDIDFSDGFAPLAGAGATLATENVEGEDVLSVTGRTDTWNAPRTPEGDSVLEADVLYEMSVMVWLPEASDVRIIAYDEGTEDDYNWIGDTSVAAETWTEISGSFTFTESGLATSWIGVEVENGTLSYYLDDFVVTPVACDVTGPPPGTVVLQSSFETDLSNEVGQGEWVPRNASAGDHTIARTDTDAAGGQWSALVSDRTAQGSGIGIDTTEVLQAGVQYVFTAQLRFAEAQPTDDIVLTFQSGDENFSTIDTYTAVTNSGWTEVTSTFTVGSGTLAFLYLETACEWDGSDCAGTNVSDFLVDEVEIKVAEPAVIDTSLTPVKDTLNVPFGIAIDQRETTGSAAELLLHHANQITSENFMKPQYWYNTEQEFAVDPDTVALMDFAVANDLDVYGHVLLWHSQSPTWFYTRDGQDLAAPDYTVTEDDKEFMRERLYDHIYNIGEYLSDNYGLFGSEDNPLTAWDVVNEVVSDAAVESSGPQDGLRRSEWYQIFGEEFIHLAFEYAEEVFNDEFADPSTDRPVALFINDYNTEQSGKQGRYLDLIDRLIAADVPIDGVGHQFHLSTLMPIEALESALANSKARNGLIQAVTELDVTVTEPVSEAKLREQGVYYRDAFELFRDYESDLFSVTVWGLFDTRSWRSEGAPLLFDGELQAKPAYYGAVDSEDLPPLLRSGNVFEGSPGVDATAVDWDRLPLLVISPSAGFQSRWSDDALTIYVSVDDATVDATDGVEIQVGAQTFAVARDGSGNVDADVVERDGGYDLVALVPGTFTEGSILDLDVRVTDDGTQTSWNTPGNLGSMSLVEALSYVEVVEATQAPTIDGSIDPVWFTSKVVSTDKQVSGSGGASATVRTLWEGDTLYVLMSVTDPVIDTSGSDPWIQDSVEVYVDAGNAKSGPYRSTDMQVRVNANNVVSFGTGDESEQAARVESATVLTDTGYNVELAIDLVGLGVEGSFHGVDFQVNDASSGSRTGIRNWAEQSGVGYQSTERWGVAKLVEGPGEITSVFPDVPETHPFYTEITWLAVTGITTGYDDGTFKPSSPVTRQAMAAFLYRFAGEPEFTAPATSPFTDVATTHPFYHEIAWLADEGISTGYDDGSFRPTARISRQAMAAFLHRVIGEEDYTPPTSQVFVDVPTSHQFFAEIAWLAESGITEGYDDGTFRSPNPVTRQAMAAFLYRADLEYTIISASPATAGGGHGSPHLLVR